MASKADLEKFFDEADKDGSGSLSVHELCSAMRTHGYRGSDETIQNFFEKSDASGNDLVSRDEYVKAMAKAPPQLHRAALMRRIFSKFDVDGNGVLNRGELKRATAILGETFSDEEIGLLMEVLDKDSSETIDMEEFIQTFLNARRS